MFTNALCVIGMACACAALLDPEKYTAIIAVVFLFCAPLHCLSRGRAQVLERAAVEFVRDGNSTLPQHEDPRGPLEDV